MQWKDRENNVLEEPLIDKRYVKLHLLSPKF